MTSAHLAESERMTSAKSSGDPPPGSSPIFANFTEGAKWMGDGTWMFDPNGDLRAYQMYPNR